MRAGGRGGLAADAVPFVRVAKGEVRRILVGQARTDGDRIDAAPPGFIAGLTGVLPVADS